MKKGTCWALILGAVPFIILVFVLPLVNRMHPVILGLPFLLFWILLWVLLTPAILLAVYTLEDFLKKKSGPAEKGAAG